MKINKKDRVVALEKIQKEMGCGIHETIRIWLGMSRRKQLEFIGRREIDTKRGYV